MAELRAWSNLCFQARLIKAHDAAAPRSSRAFIEAYLDGQAAALIECAGQPTNRVVPNIRAVLAESGGVIAAQGAVGYRFNHVGRLAFAPGASLRDISGHARLAEAIISHADKCIEILTDPNELGAVETQLARNGLRPALRGVVRRAWNGIEVSDGAPARAAGLLLLAGLEGVLAVYTDAIFPDEVLAQV